MDKYTSFGNHITERYSNDIRIIQKNINLAFNAINNITDIFEVQLSVQYNNYVSMRLLNILQRIERTISMAFSETTNLEIISNSELIAIIKHLQLTYKQDKVFISPYKYHLQNATTEFWTDEKCKKIENQAVCSESPIVNKCSLSDSKSCVYALVNNDYKLYRQLDNGKILTSSKSTFEIVEECLDNINHFKVTNNALISSENSSKIIIGEQIFENTFNNFSYQSPLIINSYESNITVNLKMEHFQNPKDLKEETKALESNIQLQPIFHFVHSAVIIVIVIVLIITGLLLYMFSLTAMSDSQEAGPSSSKRAKKDSNRDYWTNPLTEKELHDFLYNSDDDVADPTFTLDSDEEFAGPDSDDDELEVEADNFNDVGNSDDILQTPETLAVVAESNVVEKAPLLWESHPSTIRHVEFTGKMGLLSHPTVRKQIKLFPVCLVI
ncbi:hypothetical protein RN001_000330 [Aquatica leii]|uniref:Uncharacterized protein n=1 Tax=Aquatica leii TaxID=1421715 RepID=A0AAN7Q2V6_9COLE|nr:hypothetical protein RN001_000330 [Aquatica leii]